MATGAVLGGLGAHVYRRRRRTSRPYDPHRDRLPRGGKEAWTACHERRDARQQLWTDLAVEIRDGVNTGLTRLTLGLCQAEPREPLHGRAAAVPSDREAPTPLRVARRDE
ncbi:hypothetical protein [Saccharothrix xinjiangensis]|uniref:Uncharacterized protein n=1 Tax=Saccharothrix xinjiangensis TaxID=204798 RepID=A0ABV9YAM8_9PSEU